MTDFLWPPDLIPSQMQWKVIDPAAVFNSPLTGATRTVSRSGARLGCTITIPLTKGTDRARIIGLLSSLRGRSNRLWMPDFSTTQRGSFPATELLTNNDFSNGTTGWTTAGAASSVVDRSVRVTLNGTAGTQFQQQVSSMASYAPYALRVAARDGQGGHLAEGRFLTYIEDTVTQDNAATRHGLTTISMVLAGGPATQYMLYPNAGGTIVPSSIAGDYIDIDWTSMARCALVDNGPNALLYSDQIDNAAWTKVQASTVANTATAPDGTSTGDGLVDTAVSNAHYIQQSATVSAAAADYCFTVALAPSSLTWAIVQLIEATGGTGATAWFNLSTGAVGTTGVGANWSNFRTFSKSLGNGWYQYTVIARKTNAATAVSGAVYTAPSDGVSTYVGSTQGFYVWRATLAQSSVPVRLTQTTSAATTGTAQTGAKLYLKGLPASTAGLLRVGDPVQIGNQINFAAAPLDSDTAGLGLLSCGLPWRVSPADNDPVIINKPMAKMILASDDLSWDTQPGQFSSFQIELVEDVT